MSGSNILQATAVAPQVAAALQLSGAGDDVVYTVPAGSSMIVKTGSLCNITNDIVLAPGGAVSAQVSVELVPSGRSADGTHRVVSLFQLNAGDTLSLADYVGNAQLGPGDAIHAQSDTAAAVDIVITGVLNS